ncbi:MAG: hypothetical protein RLZ98_1913 [Pseudomonadota bacterium]|jgi:uncharacterized membrane protein YraQ (UPF0718 family)
MAPKAGRQLTFKELFDVNFFAFGVLTIIAGIACYFIIGTEAFWGSFESDLELFLMILPRFIAAMFLAAFVQVLLPRDKIARYLSDKAGLSALLITTLVGSATPGGPMTSFPLVQALEKAGTGRSVLITYLTSWSTNGFQRVINWELPLLGFEFAALRYACAFPLAIIAGLTSRLLPAKKRPATPAGEKPAE